MQKWFDHVAQSTDTGRVQLPWTRVIMDVITGRCCHGGKANSPRRGALGSYVPPKVTGWDKSS
ncbi:hypothetical protein I545_1379 [Mycobacterium kansasii 662]|uniref:Uncharacterized protein n=2 Tax=Mycobacterium kansasii TaxID=1768 RepID=A0A1V3XRG8_MYCKA|nr:hypothetical protein I547_5222 [Mycobacterium kansasii 824]EUA21153.1 hypothetical protein I545_1379 [Mycobacterium kansasii 662]KEP42594.1 hypothetical protein MKSMC1_22800 [Mycobacterium kansasii]OOK66047.1 hypothetical protein BZL29_7611 [Mycobacterium kansasii]OOK81813.1 hypothetical protein BZL30_0122 [Mycobacterium kansasii]